MNLDEKLKKYPELNTFSIKQLKEAEKLFKIKDITEAEIKQHLYAIKKKI